MAEVPEFLAGKMLLAARQGVNLGPAVTGDMSTPTLLHFQRFREGMQTALSSAEMHADGCIYFAYTPALSPPWYDSHYAVDMAPLWNVPPRRNWAGDPRTYRELFSQNVGVENWRNTALPPNQNGPFPRGRGPAPRWFRLCVPPGVPPAMWGMEVLNQIPAETAPRADTGSLCNFQVTGVGSPFGRGVPEWIPVPGGPELAEGIVTNSFLSGEDLTISHYPPPPSYWLGRRTPVNFGECSGAMVDPNNPGATDPRELLNARAQLCSDWNGNVLLDPQYRRLLAANRHNPMDPDPDRARGNFSDELKSNLVLENEQWLMPVGYRPEPGDRILVTGRWIADCGHSDWHMELHPMHLVVSSYLINDVPTNAFLEGTPNRPMVADDWRRITGGITATVTKVVVTGDWPGGRLEFDVWPPVRPAALTTLRFTREMGIQNGIRVVSETPQPAGNPNHLHVVIEAPMINLPTGRLNDIRPDPRRLVTAYLLWWQTPVTAGPAEAAPGMAVGRIPTL